MDSTEVPAPCLSFLSLDQDCQRLVVSKLDARDFIRFTATCRDLLTFQSCEMCWEAYCRALFKHPAYPALADDDPGAFLAWSTLPSFRVLHKALRTLGCWPEGIWRQQDPGKPQGQLFLMHMADRGPVLRASALSRGLTEYLVDVFSIGLDPALPCGVGSWVYPHLAPAWLGDAQPQGAPDSMRRVTGWPPVELPTPVVLTPVVSGGHLREVTVSCRSDTYQESTLCGSADCTMPAHQSVEPESKWSSVVPGTEVCRPSFRLLYEGQPSAAPFPARLTPLPSGGFDPLPLLLRLEGLWCAPYGPHGVECIRVRVEGLANPATHTHGITGPRLTGFKVTGDRNVPAGYHSFVANATRFVEGHWDGWEAPNVNRPIYAVSDDDFVGIVQLAARDIAARFEAVGLINEIPLHWNPHIVPATVLVYNGETARFSLLWSDTDRNYRHMMDFYPARLHRRAPLRRQPTAQGLRSAS